MSTDAICILSSVHFVHDVRMFQAEARTLAQAGFRVTVIALDDCTDSTTDGVSIIPLPLPKNRLQRMMRTGRILRLALRQSVDLYAIHDPELLPIAVLLNILTQRPIIYDVHEDVPASIRNRRWLGRPLRPLVAILYRLIERFALHFINGLTLADHAYGRYYEGSRTLTVLNYPLTSYAGLYNEFSPRPQRPTLIYTGSITRLRGLYEMIDMVQRLQSQHTEILLRLVGPFGSETERKEALDVVKHHGIEDHVEFTGPVSHEDVHRMILQADLGLALLHPDPNYLRSLPTKMFEYMMMGRAVVVSNFPLWQQIVDDCQCGYAVDPQNLDSAVTAVDKLLSDPLHRERMGVRGRNAVLEKYSWDSEGAQMVEFYRESLASSS